jgi:hypothetical protein
LHFASIVRQRESPARLRVSPVEKIQFEKAIRVYADGDILLFHDGICSRESDVPTLRLPPGARRSE